MSMYSSFHSTRHQRGTSAGQHHECWGRKLQELISDHQNGILELHLPMTISTIFMCPAAVNGPKKTTCSKLSLYWSKSFRSWWACFKLVWERQIGCRKKRVFGCSQTNVFFLRQSWTMVTEYGCRVVDSDYLSNTEYKMFCEDNIIFTRVKD